MAITITLTPNVTSYSLGDAAISASMAGQGNAATGSDYLWETNSGSFVNKFAATTNYTPDNATKVVLITARRVYHSNYSGTVNTTFSGSFGGVRKITGSTTAWDAYAFFSDPWTSNNVFYEASPVDISTEKAIGFVNNSAYINPDTTNANPDLTFVLCWHMLPNGTAVPKKAGSALANPIIYKSEDLFRITLTPTVATFTLNGVTVATTIIPTASSLYAINALKTVGAIVNDPSYFIDPNNVGIKSLSVTGIFPVQPNYTYELSSDNNTLSSIAEDGSGYFRKKGGQKRVLSLQFNERPYSEYLQISQFWKYHEKHEKFIYQDVVLSDNYIMRFDAGLRTNVLAPDSITMQITLREA